jgi:sirohydrochlorin cobaltochelatase
MKKPIGLGLKHAALECSSLKASLAFYQEHFGMEPYLVSDSDWAMLQLGDTYLSLVPVPRLEQKPLAQGSHGSHLGLVFVAKVDVDSLHAHFAGRGVSPLGKPTLHRDGSYGFYVGDPDGNTIECIFIPHRSSTTLATAEAWVLLAHGSRDPEWALPFQAIVKSLAEHVPSAECALAFMEFQQPDFPSAIRSVVQGKKRVRVFPVFLSNGGVHMERDVPELVDAARKAHPEVEFILSGASGESLLVQQAVVAAIVRSTGSQASFMR